MFGGHQTSAKTLTSIMLYIKRYPKWEQLIKTEITEIIFENGKYSSKDLWTWLTGDLLDNCLKTSFFIKEVLRIAPPATRSLGYIAMKDFKFKDGLHVKKGQIITVNNYASHFWPTEWQRPEEFLPERFDQNSSLFKTGEGKNWLNESFCPFIFGPW